MNRDEILDRFLDCTDEDKFDEIKSTLDMFQEKFIAIKELLDDVDIDHLENIKKVRELAVKSIDELY